MELAAPKDRKNSEKRKRNYRKRRTNLKKKFSCKAEEC